MGRDVIDDSVIQAERARRLLETLFIGHPSGELAHSYSRLTERFDVIHFLAGILKRTKSCPGAILVLSERDAFLRICLSLIKPQQRSMLSLDLAILHDLCHVTVIVHISVKDEFVIPCRTIVPGELPCRRHPIELILVCGTPSRGINKRPQVKGIHGTFRGKEDIVTTMKIPLQRTDKEIVALSCLFTPICISIKSY